jgi:alkylhydroperoxidase family enzyme
MTATHEPLNLAPLSNAEWPESISSIRNGFAGQLNVYRVMAHHPALLQAWTNLRNHVVLESSLPARWREIVILRTGKFIGSKYEWTHHVERGRAAGLTEAEIEAVATDASADEFTPTEKLLVRAVDVLLESFCIPHSLRGALAAHVSAQNLLDLMATVGMYLTLGFIVKTFETPIELHLRNTV